MLDPEVGMKVAGFPWLQHGVGEASHRAITMLSKLMDAAPESGQFVAAHPWLNDGVTEHESYVLQYLVRIAAIDPSLAAQMAAAPWMADGLSEEDWWLSFGILNISLSEGFLAEQLIGLPWVKDALVEGNRRLMEIIASISVTDGILAQRLLSLPWLLDGLTPLESKALRQLIELQGFGLHRVLALLDEVQPFPADEQPVRLIVLATTSTWGSLNSLYDNLLESFFLRHAVVSLPLAGEVNLWAIRPEPFPPDEPVMDMMEHAVRTLEDFTQISFPTTDVIMLTPLAGPYSHHGIPGAAHYGRFIIVPRHAYRGFDRGAVYHEVAHYVFAGEMPPWLKEGGAEFMFLYANDLAGWEPLEQRRYEWERNVRANCMRHGVFTIQELNKRLAEQDYAQSICNYTLGSFFLIRLWEVLGDDVLGPALGQVYVFWESVQRVITEEEILEVLLHNIPPDLHEEFFAIYHELHTPPSPGGTG